MNAKTEREYKASRVWLVRSFDRKSDVLRVTNEGKETRNRLVYFVLRFCFWKMHEPNDSNNYLLLFIHSFIRQPASHGPKFIFTFTRVECLLCARGVELVVAKGGIKIARRQFGIFEPDYSINLHKLNWKKKRSKNGRHVDALEHSTSTDFWWRRTDWKPKRRRKIVERILLDSKLNTIIWILFDFGFCIWCEWMIDWLIGWIAIIINSLWVVVCTRYLIWRNSAYRMKKSWWHRHSLVNYLHNFHQFSLNLEERIVLNSIFKFSIRIFKFLS